MDPQAPAAFEAKVAATRAVTPATAPVGVRLATTGIANVSRPRPARSCSRPPRRYLPESWVKIAFDAQLPSPGRDRDPVVGAVVHNPGRERVLRPGLQMHGQCDPDAWNPVRPDRARSTATDFASRASGPRRSRRDPPRAVDEAVHAPPPVATTNASQGTELTIEDAGFAPQPPARTYAVTWTPRCNRADGQTLGYTVDRRRRELAPARVHELRRRPRRVGEASGGAVLPFYARNFHNVTQWAAPIASGELMPTLLQRCRRTTSRRRRRGDGTARRLGGHRRSHRVARPRSGAARSTPAARGWCGRPSRKATPIAASRSRYGDEPRRARRSSRSRTSASPSRTARRTRWCSSRGSTPARRCRRAVSIVRLDNQRVLERHDRRGRRRDRAATRRCATPSDWWKFAFIVTAEKDGDVAYVGSDWNEGHPAVGVRHRASTCSEARAAAARHGVHRSRRLQARRGSALQGDPAAATRRTASGCCPPARRVVRHACATARTATSTSAR